MLYCNRCLAMPEPEQILPLFPLNVVLFPRAPLPLHIFEERYKQMVAAVLEGEGLFGVICTDGEGAARTGCCAKIVKIINRYDDGRMDILTVGVRRFRIARVLREEAYLQARVRYFGDDAAGDLPELVDRCLRLFHDIYQSTPGNLPRDELERSSTTVVSFYVAFFSDLALKQKQRLLELTNPEARLRQIHAALRTRQRERRERLERARLVQGNGHIPPG